MNWEGEAILGVAYIEFKQKCWTNRERLRCTLAYDEHPKHLLLRDINVSMHFTK